MIFSFCKEQTTDNSLGAKLNKVAEDLNLLRPVYPSTVFRSIQVHTKSDFLSVSLMILSKPLEEIAKQLTLLEERAFNRIEHREFLACAWNKPRQRYLAQNLLDFIYRSNHTALWVGFSILIQSREKDRIHLISFFISLALYLMNVLHNYATAMSILIGLNSAAIKRLKSSFAALPQTTQDEFSHLMSIISPEGNYRILRKSQEALCRIPFLGTYLSDLTMIEEFPDYVDETNLIINFRKNLSMSASIRRIMDFQRRNAQTPTDYSEVIPTYQLLSEFGSSVDEEALYNLSLQREIRRVVDPGPIHTNPKRKSTRLDHSPNPPSQLPSTPHTSPIAALSSQFSF